MAELATNYFVCTLGEAAELRAQNNKTYTTVTDLIEKQAQSNPNLPAFAFPIPGPGTIWDSQIYTFKDVYNESITFATTFQSQLTHYSSTTVALLCPSSIDFVFAWLGLMRAGFSVLIIAPQCQPAAIVHLCNSCHVGFLFHDEAYSELAQSASSTASFDLNCQALIKKNQVDSHGPSGEFRTQSSDDVAFLFHTSGTSTGLPKPIPQSHHAAVGVLPSLDGRDSGTFTTTPLYHGGIADCLRAWTSSALIWLFPGADVPITSRNILLSIACAEKAEREQHTSSVSYFASVPYILQMLAEEDDGLNMLKRMQLVSVGGAALPQNVGDRLVNHEVNLVSRFGSAECGFLLSSHRLYEKDKKWQYLRLPATNKYLSFEPEDDNGGLSQLIVLPTWPHIAKTNRPDGSFATSDLFEPHSALPNAWKYHSRSDSQITLSTGKKFDPGPLEDSISSASPLIRDVLIFGNGQQVPGLLVFPSSAQKNDEDMENTIWIIVQDMNSQGQDHTRISRSMMTILSQNEDPLPKSSKGTIMRNVANAKYAKQIEAAYNGGSQIGLHGIKPLSETSSEENVRDTVRKVVTTVTSNKDCLDDHADFYQHGIDSAMCSQIRGRLAKIAGPDVKLPWSIVYDCGTIAALSKHIFETLQGKSPTQSRDTSKEMLDLVTKYSNFLFPLLSHPRRKEGPTTILLTGATGSLGAHILHILLLDASISKVTCLVRAKTDEEARNRVNAALTRRGKDLSKKSRDRFVCYASSLGSSDLGLTSSKYEALAEEVTHVIHSAWAVNFSLPLQSFSDNMAGLHNLLALTIASKQNAKMIFCSSTASVLSSSDQLIHESMSIDPKDADSLGYSQSKWVAESICSSASKHDGMRGRISILRIGQLTGDTKNGIWNMSEAWPLMLSTVHKLGCLPNLKNERLGWLPVDVAARAVCDIALASEKSEAHGARSGDDGEKEECPVYHLVANITPTTPTWSNLLIWAKNAREASFEIVAPEIWLEKLRNLDTHPAQALLGLWDRAYGGQQDGKETQLRPTKLFDVTKAEVVSESMRDLKLVDEEFVGRIWGWLEGEIAAKA